MAINPMHGTSYQTHMWWGAEGAETPVSASDRFPVAATGYIVTPSSNFTRPADTTAYASGDLVANSTTAGSVTALSWTVGRVSGGAVMVRRARLNKSGTTTTNASFRLHLYDTSPLPPNAGDNGAWLTAVSGYLGSIDLDISGSNGRVFSDASKVVGAPAVGAEISVVPTVQTIYGLLEARAAYTPASAEVFTVVLEVIQVG